MGARRLVQFVVTSRVWTGAELVQRLGPADERVETVGDTVGRPGALRVLDKSAWVASSGLAESASIEAHLTALHDRVRPSVEGFVSSGGAPLEGMLRIVQYLPNSESQGHGFVIGPEWINILDATNGVIDVDQYVVANEDVEAVNHGEFKG